MLTMMGSNKVCRKSSFGKPKTPRLGISGIDYVNGLANHGYNHFHMNGGGISGSKHDDHSQPLLSSSPSAPQQLLQSIEVVQHQQQQLLHRHLDVINKANSLDSRTSSSFAAAAAAGCKLKRKKLQPFEPTYYFDSDFDSEDGGSGSGRRRGSTLNCSPSIVSRFLRLSRRKSSTSSSKGSKNKHHQQDDQQPLTSHETFRDELQQVELHEQIFYTFLNKQRNKCLFFPRKSKN